MSKHPTTIRLDPVLYKGVLREAKKKGMSFSNVVHLLLYAFTEGSIQIGVTQYPQKYLKTLEKESKELDRLYRKGQAKGYGSSQDLFDDILER